MVLQYYLKTGTCKFGATCKFHHPRDKAGIAGRVSLNILGYPLRPVRFFISLYSCYWNWFECANHVRLFISPSLDSPNFGTLISFFLLFHFFFGLFILLHMNILPWCYLYCTQKSNMDLNYASTLVQNVLKKKGMVGLYICRNVFILEWNLVNLYELLASNVQLLVMGSIHNLCMERDAIAW